MFCLLVFNRRTDSVMRKAKQTFCPCPLSEAWETRSLMLAALIVLIVWTLPGREHNSCCHCSPHIRHSATEYIHIDVYRSVCCGQIALKQIEHKEGTNGVTEPAVMQSVLRSWYHPWTTGCSVAIYLLFQMISVRNLSKSVAFQQHKLYYDY